MKKKTVKRKKTTTVKKKVVAAKPKAAISAATKPRSAVPKRKKRTVKSKVKSSAAKKAAITSGEQKAKRPVPPGLLAYMQKKKELAAAKQTTATQTPSKNTTEKPRIVSVKKQTATIRKPIVVSNVMPKTREEALSGPNRVVWPGCSDGRCRPCGHVIDIPFPQGGGMVSRFICEYHFNNECPEPRPKLEHEFNDNKVCVNCGLKR